MIEYIIIIGIAMIGIVLAATGTIVSIIFAIHIYEINKKERENEPKD